MPFTPFHFGPALLFSLLFLSCLDLPTMIVASIAVDVEPALALIFNLSYPWYGWFHSLEGSIVAASIVIILIHYCLTVSVDICEFLRTHHPLQKQYQSNCDSYKD